MGNAAGVLRPHGTMIYMLILIWGRKSSLLQYHLHIHIYTGGIPVVFSQFVHGLVILLV